MGKSKGLIGLFAIVLCMMFRYLATSFFTEGEEPKVKFLLNPGEWEYLSVYLWRIGISLEVAVVSFVAYLNYINDDWIKAAYLGYFIISAVMVLNYILTRNQVDIEPFIVLWLGFTLVVASREVKWKR